MIIMKNYGIVYSSVSPQPIEVTSSSVFIASNIGEYEEEIEGKLTSGFKYNLIQYSKDEYIKILEEKNQRLEADLLDTQSALCDIYELLEGGLE